MADFVGRCSAGGKNALRMDHRDERKSRGSVPLAKAPANAHLRASLQGINAMADAAALHTKDSTDQEFMTDVVEAS
ncbi:MAG: hypothetical protein R3C04_04155 [Hyphomonas sp.]